MNGQDVSTWYTGTNILLIVFSLWTSSTLRDRQCKSVGMLFSFLLSTDLRCYQENPMYTETKEKKRTPEVF